jgi:hypothetical protein
MYEYRCDERLGKGKGSTCGNTGKERDSYLLYVRKLDIEMSPDTLEVEGVNKLFVTVTVDKSFIPEQTVSGSLGTHRTRSSN